MVIPQNTSIHTMFINYKLMDSLMKSLGSNSVLPPNIHILHLEGDDIPLDFGSDFFKNITHIYFKDSSRHNIHSFPPNLVYLQFHNFHGEIDSFPSKLQTLIFGPWFNRTFANIPYGLKYLDIGGSPNCKFESLPSTITTLIMSQSNSEITSLPQSLIHFEQRNEFKGDIRILPRSIKTLSLGVYKEDYNGLLPESVLKLTIGRCDEGLIRNLPNGIRVLTFKSVKAEIIQFPLRLKELSIESKYLHPLTNLPQGLLYLRLMSFYEHELDFLPKSLIGFYFQYYRSHGEEGYAHQLDNLPLNLKKAFLDVGFITELDYLPDHITHLTLGLYNQSLDNLPSTLTTLIFNSHSKFNQRLDHLPKDLKWLVMPSEYNQPLDYLPNGLLWLELGNRFLKALKFLPQSLKVLTMKCEVLKRLEVLKDHSNLIHLGIACYHASIKKKAPFTERNDKLGKCIRRQLLDMKIPSKKCVIDVLDAKKYTFIHPCHANNVFDIDIELQYLRRFYE